MGGGASMGAPNAAALAASLYPSWQQGLAGPTSFPLQALPMERGVSWGAELLPFIDGDDPAALAGSLAADLGGGGDSPTSAEARSALMQGMGMGGRGGGDDGGGGRPVHKQRFVWTGELHRRFEAAVNTLGVDQAKPQVLALPRKTRTPPAGTSVSVHTCAHGVSRFGAPALPRCCLLSRRRVVVRAQAISQLMNCEGEGAPTRQNIKSHLQKYRLLIQKRQRQGGGSGDGIGGSSDGVGDSGSGGGSGTGGGSEQPTDVQSELEQHLARQEMNLRVQMDLQTKLHRQLLVQRQLQHQLEHCFPTQGGDPDKDKQRYQATLQLKNSLRERLTTHVMLQQEMLQHLDTLVSNEVSKSTDETTGGDPAEETSEAADTAGSEKADEF